MKEEIRFIQQAAKQLLNKTRILTIGILLSFIVSCTSTTSITCERREADPKVYELVKVDPAKINIVDTKQSFIIYSTPSEAAVFIDGKKQGITPLEISIKPSRFQYTIEIVKEGYQTEKIMLRGRLLRVFLRGQSWESSFYFWHILPEGAEIEPISYTHTAGTTTPPPALKILNPPPWWKEDGREIRVELKPAK